MFKLVAFLCAVVCVAAKPGVLLAPVAYSSTLVSPGFTSISKSASSVVHPTPYALTYPYAAAAYGAYPYAHVLKKRSAPILSYGSYGYPLASTYSYYTPSLYSSVITPAVPLASPIAPITYSHLIKKRSAALIAPLAVPAATSYQSRIDVKNVAPIAYSTAYAAPYTYASPYCGYGYPCLF